MSHTVASAIQIDLKRKGTSSCRLAGARCAVEESDGVSTGQRVSPNMLSNSDLSNNDLSFTFLKA